MIGTRSICPACERNVCVCGPASTVYPEVEKLRALLAEARQYVAAFGRSPPSVLDRIDAALAEPVAFSYTQDSVNRMTDALNALRKDYGKAAYKRGAEAMREAAARCVEARHGENAAERIRALPVPEDKR